MFLMKSRTTQASSRYFNRFNIFNYGQNENILSYPFGFGAIHIHNTHKHIHTRTLACIAWDSFGGADVFVVEY